MPKVGILTGGGDAPGLNTLLFAATKTLTVQGYEAVGICDGFEGIFDQRTVRLDPDALLGLQASAGTFLGTSNKTGTSGREEEFRQKYRALDLEGLIVAGGDGTFLGLEAFKDDIPIVGTPKTIDNDLSGTDVTFGFDTACTVVSGAVDSLRATAHAHRRLIVVEAMGRTAGWITLGSGLAAMADAILIPEKPFSRKALKGFLQKKIDNGQRGLIIVVAEGAAPEGEAPLVARRVEGSPEAVRLGGIAEQLAKWLDDELPREARHVVPGHLQRSHSPTTTDRFLTTSMGVRAAELAMAGKFHRAVVYRQGAIVDTDLGDIIGPPRRIPRDHRWIKMAEALGIFI